VSHSIRIREARSAADLRRFVDLPWRIYNATDHPQWVPPLKLVVRDALDEKKNPFYQNASRALFLAERDGKVVGRIAAIENRAHNATHGDRVGFWGFFECIDEADVAAALFNAAESWLGARRLTVMRGPVSPSLNHEAGLLVRGFRWPPTVMTTWNPRYYVPLVEGAGFALAKELLGFFLPMDDARFELPPQFAEHAARARASSRLTFRDINLQGDFTAEAERCRLLYNAAWADNWGFVPMTVEEFRHLADGLKLLLRSDFAFMAELDGRPAGFLVVLPDFNHVFKRIGTGRLFPTGWLQLLLGKSRLRTGRVVLLGVAPEFRSRSILQLFAHELYQRGRAVGAMGAEASWILEDNHLMRKPLEVMGAKAYRTWRVYDRPINALGSRGKGDQDAGSGSGQRSLPPAP
jgi:GNAT superfamily N-acetyltransferase